MQVYFDHAATTPLRKEVLDAMMPYLTTEYGNPSSQYELGKKANMAVEDARNVIADSINANIDEIFFTSGGSEANSWAIKGYYYGKDFYDKSIITSCIEHHSLLNAVGYAGGVYDAHVFYVRNDENGLVSLDDLNALLKEFSPSIVSIMALNNEIGTIEPITEIGAICHEYGATFHTDAVQAYGHIPIDVDAMNIDLMSVSGHKINGPKGIGFLYARKDVQKNLHPLVNGGQQEWNMRGGTENVASIVGLAKAAELSISEMEKVNSKNLEIKNRLRNYIAKQGGHINGNGGSPNHLSFRFDGIRAELWHEFFNEHGICVSSGSACNSLSSEPSHVLKAIGLSDAQADETIRMSFGNTTTQKETEYVIQVLNEGVELLTPPEEDEQWTI